MYILRVVLLGSLRASALVMAEAEGLQTCCLAIISFYSILLYQFILNLMPGLSQVKVTRFFN